MKRELISETAFVSELEKGPLVGVKYSAVNVRSFDTIAPNHRGMEEAMLSHVSRDQAHFFRDTLGHFTFFNLLQVNNAVMCTCSKLYKTEFACVAYIMHGFASPCCVYRH